MQPVYNDKQQPESIVGIAVRTHPSTAAKDIRSLWERWFQEDIGTTLGQGTAPLYAVCYDYESDFRGHYTTLLGIAFPLDAPIPTGVKTGIGRVTLPTGNYAIFSASGVPGKAIYEAWNEINGVWAAEHQRRYAADFECYRTLSPQYVEAEIWVGVQNS